VQLYRTFLLAESPRVMAGRYADARLTVPTRLVNGDSDLVSSHATLDGFQANADDMTVEIVEDVGHFVPEEAPEVVAARARALFG
jgi:pimeloyl-ACP methyl ester carboxylesterase